MPQSSYRTERQSIVNRENILTKSKVINEKISLKNSELECFVTIVFLALIHLIRLVATAQNPNEFNSSQSWLTIS